MKTTRHIGIGRALCDGRKRAELREDLGPERYRLLGVKERFAGQEPYRVCAACIKRVADVKWMANRWRAARTNGDIEK